MKKYGIWFILSCFICACLIMLEYGCKEKNAEVKKPEDAILAFKSIRCSYCKKKMFNSIILIRGKEDIHVCGECLILTFDLMLGRGEGDE